MKFAILKNRTRQLEGQHGNTKVRFATSRKEAKALDGDDTVVVLIRIREPGKRELELTARVQLYSSSKKQPKTKTTKKQEHKKKKGKFDF